MTNPVNSRCLTTLSGILAMFVGTSPMLAQTDYYNTDAGRPLQIEDAHPVERRAFEIQAAPFRVERSRGGSYHWSIEPEIAYGVFPRTQIEVGFPLAFMDGPDGNTTVGLYEPLVVNSTRQTRQAGVRATTARFWQMLERPPETMPYQMPMTAAVAPEFTRRYPEAAIIFDNLHSMHDVISDILANDLVPRHRKRSEILLAAKRFRDDTSYVMSVDAWLAMSHHMVVENMGGPATGFVGALPTPTVTYGAVMTHDDRTGAMLGFTYGSATGGEHKAHQSQSLSTTPPAARPAPRPTPAKDPHAGHGVPRPAPSDTTHKGHRP